MTKNKSQNFLEEGRGCSVLKSVKNLEGQPTSFKTDEASLKMSIFAMIRHFQKAASITLPPLKRTMFKPASAFAGDSVASLLTQVVNHKSSTIDSFGNVSHVL